MKSDRSLVDLVLLFSAFAAAQNLSWPTVSRGRDRASKHAGKFSVLRVARPPFSAREPERDRWRASDHARERERDNDDRRFQPGHRDRVARPPFSAREPERDRWRASDHARDRERDNDDRQFQPGHRDRPPPPARAESQRASHERSHSQGARATDGAEASLAKFAAKRAGTPSLTHRSGGRRRSAPRSASKKTIDWAWQRVASDEGALAAARCAAARPRAGVLYLAIGASNWRKVAKSAASVRAHADPEVGVVVITDTSGHAHLARWQRPYANLCGDSSARPSPLLFDFVISIGSMSQSGKRNYTNLPEFEGHGVVGDGSINKKEAVRRLRILKIRSFEIGLLLFERLLFLDVDTAVCAPLAPVFSVLAQPAASLATLCAADPTRRGWWSSAPPTAAGGADVAFVPVDGGKHQASSTFKALGVPRQFVEANTGVLLVRNSTRARQLVQQWLATYIHETRKHDHLMDQPAFRIALWRTNASHIALCGALNCRGWHRREAVPLACGGFGGARAALTDAQRPLAGGRGCVVLHSHILPRDSSRTGGGAAAAASARLPNAFTTARAELPRDAKLRLLVLFPGVGTRDDDRFARLFGRGHVLQAGDAASYAALERCAAGCALFVLFPDPAATAARPTDTHSHVLLEALLAVTTTPDWSDAAARRERDGDATEADLQLVLGWLEARCAAVGLAARSEESLELFETALGQRERDGAASTKRTHTRAARAALNWTGSALDEPLYDGAVALFERQLRVMAWEE